MSTYLELCNIVAKECGNDPLTSVTSQTGNRADTVRWVGEAWMDVQRAQRWWLWMREAFSFSTVAAQQAYTPRDAVPTGVALTDFREWHIDSLRIYSSVADEQHLTFKDYQAFRDTYQFGSISTQQNRPTVFAVRPKDKALMLAYIPDAVYTVRGDYQKRATEFASATDEPDMPDEFHMLVAYGAMMKYAYAENAAEVLSRAKESWGILMKQLMADQLPAICNAEPLF